MVHIFMFCIKHTNLTLTDKLTATNEKSFWCQADFWQIIINVFYEYTF